MQMGKLVRVRSGHWSKTDDDVWTFNQDPSEMEQFIIASSNEEFESLKNLVREELCIAPQTPVVLSYQLPLQMLMPSESTSAPTRLLSSGDVEVMMSVHEWTNEVQIYATSGAANVAKFQFLFREPFTVGDTTYLSGGITEKAHLERIYDMMGRDEICCSARMLTEILTEDKLVLLYRFSLEMEKARQMFEQTTTAVVNLDRDDVQMDEIERELCSKGKKKPPDFWLFRLP
ncbi:uncharacterized protein LOC130504039 [Raphanus sativus]|uniref:Uncharacterized protein LOC130504039 n=1 Tax=Raphanus sativus TaxID=3726 RepID=A0A9W3CSU2_RAPSA|nr:uncharacterized protein LOC130504039 [Raphanus sativus]